MKRIVTYSVIGILCIIIILLASSDQKKFLIHATMGCFEPEYEVLSGNLDWSYEQDTHGSDIIYKNKCINITGRIRKVTPRYIELYGYGVADLNGVKCYMSLMENRRVQNVDKTKLIYRYVKLRGVVFGQVFAEGGVVVRHCTILAPLVF